MRRKEWLVELVLLLTGMVGWLALFARPFPSPLSFPPPCRHECFDANQCGHCGDIVYSPPPTCLGVEACHPAPEDNCDLLSNTHKKLGQCIHAGNRRWQFVTSMVFDCTGDGHPDCECKGYHSCPKEEEEPIPPETA
jgi:hypothetical protein